MTNEQFQKLKKVFNFVKPGITSLEFLAYYELSSILKKLNIDYDHHVTVNGKYVSFMFSDLSKLTLKNGKKGFILTWTNKPKLDKSVTPEPMYKVASLSKDFIPLSQWLETGNSIENELEVYINGKSAIHKNETHVSKLTRYNETYIVETLGRFFHLDTLSVRETSNSTIVKELMLVDYLAKGYKLEDVREVKILNNPNYEPDEFSDKIFKTKLEKYFKDANYFLMVDISPTAFNQEDVMVTDWYKSPPSGAGQSKDCGQSNKFIPLTEWLKTEPPHAVKKARVKGTPILSDTVIVLKSNKVLLDDHIVKYDISQIEVR